MPFHGLGLQLPYAALLGGANGRYPLLSDPYGVASTLLDEYPTKGLYYHNGIYYPSAAALATARGASGAWPKLTAGPNVFGSQIVANGTFDTDASGWSAVSGVLSAPSGKLVHTNNTGATAAMQSFQDIAFTAGATYELSVDVVGGFARQIAVTDTSNTVIMALGAPSSAGTYKFYFAAQTTATRLNLRANNVGNGSAAQWDNISVKECRPFIGCLPNGMTMVFRGVTPASVASDQVIWENGGLNEDNRIRLVYKSDGHLHFIESRDISTGAADRINLDLGAVAASTAFRAAVTAKAGAYYAALNGLLASNSAAADYPAGAIMYDGTDSASADWLGSSVRRTIIPAGLSGDAVSGLCNPGNLLAMPGDSGVAGGGTPTVGLAATAMAAGRAVYISGIAAGGTDDSTQLAAFTALRGLADYNTIWDDYRANTGFVKANYLANQVTFQNARTHSRWIRCLPVTVFGEDPTTRDAILDLVDSLKAIIPAGHWIDPVDFVPNTNRVINADQMSDGVHLTQAAENLKWAGVDALATALGMYSYVSP